MQMGMRGLMTIWLGARRRELCRSFENSLKVMGNAKLHMQEAQHPVSRIHKKEIHTSSLQ